MSEPAVTAPARDVVTLRVPADPTYVALVRTAAAGLGSRLPFTIDELEDLRLAVGEAAALLAQLAPPGAELACEFAVDTGVHCVLTCATRDGHGPDPEGFGWALLAALVDGAASTATPTGASIRLHKAPGHPTP